MGVQPAGLNLFICHSNSGCTRATIPSNNREAATVLVEHCTLVSHQLVIWPSLISSTNRGWNQHFVLIYHAIVQTFQDNLDEYSQVRYLDVIP